MLQGEHFAILLAFIKLPFVIKIFVLSIFEWVFYTGFTEYYLYIKISPSFENRERSAWALVGIDAFLLLLYNSLWFNFKCTCISCHILSKLHARHLTCVLILNVRVFLATFSVNSMPCIWAVICDFQQCGVLTSVDSDNPLQPPFKLKNSK